jgi:hypothetical protein
MKKIEFVGSVSVEKLVKFYGINDSFFDGNGVYRIKIGCRGEIEEVVKMSNDNSVVVMEVKDILKDIENGDLEVSMMEYGIEKVKEFVFSEFVDCYENEIGIIYGESWDEEDGYEYVNVEIF